MNNATCCPGWCVRADSLLDVPGIHVVAVANTAREQIITVETDEALNWCPVCGFVAVGHGRRIACLHDPPLTVARFDWIGPNEYGVVLILTALPELLLKLMCWRRRRRN